MLEKLDFKKLMDETLTIHRIPRVMTVYTILAGNGAGSLFAPKSNGVEPAIL